MKTKILLIKLIIWFHFYILLMPSFVKADTCRHNVSWTHTRKECTQVLVIMWIRRMWCWYEYRYCILYNVYWLWLWVFVDTGTSGANFVIDGINWEHIHTFYIHWYIDIHTCALYSYWIWDHVFIDSSKVSVFMASAYGEIRRLQAFPCIT